MGTLYISLGSCEGGGGGGGGKGRGDYPRELDEGSSVSKLGSPVDSVPVLLRAENRRLLGPWNSSLERLPICPQAPAGAAERLCNGFGPRRRCCLDL